MLLGLDRCRIVARLKEQQDSHRDKEEDRGEHQKAPDRHALAMGRYGGLHGVSRVRAMLTLRKIQRRVAFGSIPAAHIPLRTV